MTSSRQRFNLQPALFMLGLISILGQVTLLRELAVAFYGVELIYLLALGIWLLWTGAGALLRGPANPSLLQTGTFFLIFAALLPATIASIRSLRLWLAPAPGAYLSFTAQLVAISLSLLPVGLLLGLLFQWCARGYLASRGTLASAYAIESAGGMAGGILSTLCLKVGIQNLAIALICSFLSFVAACILIRKTRNRWIELGLPLSATVLLVALGLAPRLDRFMTSWNHPDLLVTRDSPYSRVTLSQLAGQISVFENDALAFETEGTQAEEFVYLAALQHSAPREVLILGGGIEGLVGKVLRQAPQRVDYVELNPVIPSLILPLLPSPLKEAFQDPRVTVSIADPRSSLDGSQVYDLILVGMPEPMSGQTNRFYTREFFQQCANRLKPGGVLAFRLRTSENFWTPAVRLRMASIYRALKGVYRSIAVLPGTVNILAGSNSELPGDPAELGRRFVSRNLTAELVSPAYIRYLYTNDRFLQIRSSLESTVAPVNTDSHPICYQYTLLIWLSKFFPDLAVLDVSSFSAFFETGKAFWHPAWLGIPLLFWIGRRWNLCRSSLLTGVAGFVGMVLETVLLLRFQARNGALFEDLGFLLMAFMAGLAAGAATMSRLSTTRSGSLWFQRLAGATLLGAFILQSLWLGKWSPAGTGGLCGVSAMLFLTGVLVSGTFAVASFQSTSRGSPQTGRIIGPLYAADLAGGSLGSLVSSLLLIPFAGLAETSNLMLPLLLSALILL
jgi:spermidine synthase